MVYLEAKDGWHRHPFTISSAPHEDVLRVTVKALGDYTSRLQELIEPGMPAVIGGPHGRFNHWKGTDRQVWIAGGRRRRAVSQLAPRARRSYCRIASTSSTRADGDAPFADEIRAIADRHRVSARPPDRHERRGPPHRRARPRASPTAIRASSRSSCAARKGCFAASRPNCDSQACPHRAHPPRVLRLAIRRTRREIIERLGHPGSTDRATFPAVNRGAGRRRRCCCAAGDPSRTARDSATAIAPEERTLDHLTETVRAIWRMLVEAERFLLERWPTLADPRYPPLPEELTFIMPRTSSPPIPTCPASNARRRSSSSTRLSSSTGSAGRSRTATRTSCAQRTTTTGLPRRSRPTGARCTV